MRKVFCMGLISFAFVSTLAQSISIPKGETESVQIIGDSVVLMPAGKQFAASGWKEFWWGKHYRKEWATPVHFPILNMTTFQGGLTPLKAGGGHESKTLRLQAADGKEYVLRTMDKNLDVLIPEEFKGTFINDLVNDQISTAHPYGSLAIAHLADQASLMHTNPIIIFVPDAQELGEFRPVFANKLCLLEERPSGKGWDHTPLAGNADDILNSEDLLEKIYSNTKNRVDQQALLKVRLFDMIVNDWDRHEDQWVWAEHKIDDEHKVYEPFGRDRDQAFSKTDGVGIWFLSRPWALRPLQNMTPTVKDLLGTNFSARFLDRQFLNELKKEEWQQSITQLQAALTDEGIQQAVNTMPAEANKFSGEWLVTRLKQRRDHLSEYGMKYYSLLSKRVTVAAAEKKEQFIVNNLNDNEVDITGLRAENDTFFHRIFYRNETKEISLYGLDGDDSFTFTGEGRNRFVIRALGGPGNNTYTSTRQSRGGKHIRIFDTLYHADLSRRAFCINKKSDSLYWYNRKAVKYDWYIPLIIPGYNPDDGVVVGLGFLYRKQHWGKTPYGWQQRLTITYAARTSAIGFGYRGIFKQTFGKWDFDMEASYKGPRYVLNYYGLGNNTPLDSNSKSYYRVKSRILQVSPGIGRTWEHTSFRLGLLYETVTILTNQDKFITSPVANIDPDVFALRYFGGGNMEWVVTTANSERNPEKGIRFTNGASYLHEFNSDGKDLLRLNSEFTFYLTAGHTLTFAHRTGAATNIGDYAFYHANTLGGSENLRGYWRSRFAGRSSFYQNTELRLKIAHLKGYVLRGQFGLIGFVDDGRVWQNGESSTSLHVGYGGGIYFLPYNALALNLYFASSKETNMVVLRAGFYF